MGAARYHRGNLLSPPQPRLTKPCFAAWCRCGLQPDVNTAKASMAMLTQIRKVDRFIMGSKNKMV